MYGRISYRFRDERRYLQYFPHPCVFNAPPAEGFSLEFCNDDEVEKGDAVTRISRKIVTIYPFLCTVPALDRQTNSLAFFHSIVHPTSSLHSLLPPPRDPDLLARLRAPPNSPAYPHELKNISPLYHTPFPVIKHRFYLHLCYTLHLQ